MSSMNLQSTSDNANKSLRNAIEAMNEGIMLYDKHLRLELLNNKASELFFGGDNAFELGRTFHEIWENLAKTGLLVDLDGVNVEDRVRLAENNVRTFEKNIHIETSDGRILVASSHATDQEGYLLTFKDVTEQRQAENEKEQINRRLTAVLDSLDIGVVFRDSEMRFVMANKAMHEMAYSKIDPPKPGETIAEIGKRQMEANTFKVHEETSIMTKDMVKDYMKDFRVELADGRILRGASHEIGIDGYLQTFTDVTNEVRAEERKLAAVNDAIQSLEEGFTLWDADLRFVMANQRQRELFRSDTKQSYEKTQVGDSFEDIIGRQFDAGIFHVPDGVTKDDLLEKWSEEIRTYSKGNEIQFDDGRTVIVSTHKTNLGGYLNTYRDVTEERNSEQRAREMLYDAMESLEEGFSLWDKDLNFQMCNQKYLDLVTPFLDEPFPAGTPSSEVNRQVFQSGHVVIPEGVTEEEFLEDLSNWSRNGGEAREFHSTDGRVAIMRVQPTALGGFLATALDITEERNSDTKARNMLLDAFEALDEGLVLCDENMNYIFGNDAWKKMMFEGLEENTPKPGDSVVENLILHVKSGFYAIPEKMSEEDYVNWMMQEMAQHGKQVHYKSADGRHFVGQSHLTAFGGSLLFVRDITKQQYAEERKLEAVNEALDAVDDPLALFTAEREFVLANKAWVEMVKGYYDPKPGDNAIAIFQKLLDGDFYNIPDGLTKQQFFDLGLEEMGKYARDFPLSLHDGRLQLVKSRETELGGFLLSYRDVTEQLRAEQELEQQREKSHQNEKLSALGELLAGVAHELNNPLSVVFGYAQMLQGKVDDPVISERIDMIGQSAERAAKIVKTFLAMARQRPAKIELCSMNDVVKTALEVSSYGLKANGTQVIMELDSQVPLVTGDFDQLAQVFSNLIVNAGHALESKQDLGCLTVRSFYDEKSDYTVVEIHDNGHGIPEEIQSRIFEPFFTTKDVGEGTGVGLAFSHRIVENHDGILQVKSEVGQGTSFFVKLRSMKNYVTDNTEDLEASRSSEQLSVLVVDDEESVARLVHDILVDRGFQVTKLINPREALHLLESQTFDAVLSDFKMPGMDGESFYNAMKIVAPECAERIGFITGDSMGAKVKAFFEKSKRPFIEKPVITKELMKLLDQLCDHEQDG